MNRKPVLFEKITKMRQGSGREVIGLIGTHHGVGVTYTGLLLAFYMGEELGRKTAFLECNTHGDMDLIQNAYEWSREGDNSFSFHMISCYKGVSPERIAETLKDDYECIIMDFGIDFIPVRNEFLRCGTKIIVGGRSEWDILKLKKFTDMVNDIRGSDTWLYLIPQANKKTIANIRNHTKVWAVPVSEEPTMPSFETYRFFRELFCP